MKMPAPLQEHLGEFSLSKEGASTVPLSVFSCFEIVIPILSQYCIAFEQRGGFLHLTSLLR